MCPYSLSQFTIIVLLFSTKHGAGSSLAISTTSNERIPPNGHSTGDIIAIKEGGDLDLSCPIVVRNEDMIISWTCDDEPANIRSSRIHVTDSGKLRIHSAKVGDSCDYRCEAANGFGTLSVVIKVIIVDRRLIDQLTRRTSGQNVTQHQSLPLPQAPINIEQGSDSDKTISSKPPTNVAKVTPVSPILWSPNSSSGRIDEPIGIRPESEPNLGAQSDKDSEIEMQIEPAKVSVSKNLTFSLECRIKYSPHPVAPQIIWLKEFIGPKPVSIQDSMEQNLILLEDVYYHSLNWPRSVIYSNKSRAASSALLIRQSNYVHSGRYVCLAGYPPAISNLHFNRSILSGEPSALANAQALSNDNPVPIVKSPIKYKTAQAYVEVDDKEGKVNYQLSLDKLVNNKRQKTSNLFMSVISNNSWMRNLTIALMLLCSVLALLKYIHLIRHPKTSRHSSKLSGSNSVRLSQSNNRNMEDATSSNLSDMGLDRSSCTNIPNNNATINNSLLKGDSTDEGLLGEKLKCLDANELDCDDDHVYSEINCHDSVEEESEPYYKQPRSSTLKSSGE